MKAAHGMMIDQNIKIKICDFGVAELFPFDCSAFSSSFLCQKRGLSITNEGIFAPNVLSGEVYDARCADNWSLGMILFECLTIGERIYSPLDVYKSSGGHWALLQGASELKQHLIEEDLLRHFNYESFSLLTGLLNLNERHFDILAHPWFADYFTKYRHAIMRKLRRNHKGITDRVLSTFYSVINDKS